MGNLLLYKQLKLKSKFSKFPQNGEIPYFISLILISIAAFIFHSSVSRLLGPSEYGLVVTFVNILAILLDPIGALQVSIAHEVALTSLSNEKFSIRNILVFLFASSLAIALVGSLFFRQFDSFVNSSSPSSYFLTLLWFPLALVSAIFQGLLIGRSKFTYIAFATLIGNGFLRIFVGILLVKNGFGLCGILIGTDFAQLFICSVLMFRCRKYIFKNSNNLQIKIYFKKTKT